MTKLRKSRFGSDIVFKIMSGEATNVETQNIKNNIFVRELISDVLHWRGGFCILALPSFKDLSEVWMRQNKLELSAIKY